MEPAPSKKLESAREREKRIRSEWEEGKHVKDSLNAAGLAEGWENESGCVAEGEMLKLVRPIVLFRDAKEVRSYMIWATSDPKAARDFAATAMKEKRAKLLLRGAKVLILSEKNVKGVSGENAIFFVEATSGEEGYASNLILRQHRAEKEPAGR